MPAEEQQFDDQIHEYLSDIQERYNEKYFPDKLTYTTAEPFDYRFRIENSEVEDLKFTASLNRSDYELEDLLEKDQPNISKLTQAYKEVATDPLTAIISFSPDAKEMEEIHKDLWWSFTNIGEEIIDPDLTHRPNFYDHLYLISI